MKLSKTRNYRAPASLQEGVTLIVVMVVLLVLTMIGLASTDSGNLQRVMVRNSQFRLEAFNSSQAEIEAQIDSYETSNAPIFTAIDGGARIHSPSGLPIQTANSAHTKMVGLEKQGECLVYGNTVGKYKCSLLIIDSNSRLNSTNIESDQRQTFSFLTLN